MTTDVEADVTDAADVGPLLATMAERLAVAEQLAHGPAMLRLEKFALEEELPSATARTARDVAAEYQAESRAIASYQLTRPDEARRDRAAAKARYLAALERPNWIRTRLADLPRLIALAERDEHRAERAKAAAAVADVSNERALLVQRQHAALSEFVRLQDEERALIPSPAGDDAAARLGYAAPSFPRATILSEQRIGQWRDQARAEGFASCLTLAQPTTTPALPNATRDVIQEAAP